MSEDETEAETELQTEELTETASEAEGSSEAAVKATNIVKKDPADVSVEEDGEAVQPGWIDTVGMKTGEDLEALLSETEEEMSEAEAAAETVPASTVSEAPTVPESYTVDEEDPNLVWIEVDTNSVVDVVDGQKLRFKVLFKVEGGRLSEENQSLAYQVPAEIKAVEEEAGAILDDDNNTVAEYKISKEGKIILTFSEEYVKKNAEGTEITIAVEFTTGVDDLAWEDEKTE